MCDPITTAALITGGATAGTAVMSARSQRAPQQPAPQPQKSPDGDLLRRRARQGLAPRGAYGTASQAALTAPVVGRTTLLGQ
jgi:hypothetical protein